MSKQHCRGSSGLSKGAQAGGSLPQPCPGDGFSPQCSHHRVSLSRGWHAGRAQGQPGCLALSRSELWNWRELILPSTPSFLLGKGCSASGESPWYEVPELHSHTLVGKQLLGTSVQHKALSKCILQELCPAMAMAEAVCMPSSWHLGFPKGKLMGAALLECLGHSRQQKKTPPGCPNLCNNLMQHLDSAEVALQASNLG